MTTDYKALAASVAANKARQVAALHETKLLHAERVNELRDARMEHRAAAQMQTKERELLDMRLPGFFPTPPQLASRMIAQLAPAPGALVLEPSAGNGHIAQAIKDKGGIPFCIEYEYSLCEVLRAKGFDPMCADFMEYFPENAPGKRFPFIAMNPPFEHGQDIRHVLHAFRDCLSSGGHMAAIMGAGAFYRSDKQAVEFREFLDGVFYKLEDLPAGTFKTSGTNVSSKLLYITKGI